MNSTDDQIQRAISAVKEINHGATDFQVIYRHPKFLNSSLYVVGFNGNEHKFENYVFIRSGAVRVAKNTSHLVDLANQEADHTISTLASTATVLGKKLKVELVPV
jgi:hypothetical protein